MMDMDVILGLGILIWIAFLIPRKKSSRCYERPNGKKYLINWLALGVGVCVTMMTGFCGWRRE